MHRGWLAIWLICALPATLAAQETDRYGEPIVHPSYPEIAHSEAKQHIGQYRTVSGRVQSVALRRDHAYLNFGKDWQTDFTVYIPKSAFKRIGPYHIRRLKQENVAVRGYIHDYYGPRITLLEPDKLERTDATAH